MKAGRPRLAARRSAMPWLLMLALAGCDRSEPEAGAVIVPPRTAATPAPAPVTSAPLRTADHIERLPSAAPTAPAQAPPAKMQVRKDFTDPPLPAELKDDGGLKPLPPPPPR
ncbi:MULTISPECIES: hypothetical protein [unclassified Sphingomonas]|jgi:hypothetical protein|uniref:hypothetical protein n=1 Tax=unclassified Sphingomonas TaxID=196159 RepID=UPI000B31E84D|nr:MULTISPECIES: hypothetical protein [unclassified Sphingomonas]